MASNLFEGNYAGHSGGAVSVDQGCDPAIMTNNTLTKNTAGLAGGGVHCSFFSHLTISNTILWDNQAPEGPEIKVGNGIYPTTIQISYSDLKGGKSSCKVEGNATLVWGDQMIDVGMADKNVADFRLFRQAEGRGKSPGVQGDLFVDEKGGGPHVWGASSETT